MNHKCLTEICTNFELGTPTKLPTRVYGGLLHIMWRINTDKASYAIKQLSKDINLRNEAIINNYELTEQIANQFKNLGIPAVSAIEKAGKHLTIIDNIGFLAYPWVEATVLNKDSISKPHALKIAEILAKMHIINLEIPEITEPKFDIHNSNKILELIVKAEKYSCPFAKSLRSHQDKIFAINNAYQTAIPVLKKHAVISHGDLDQKNVLWDENNNPILIDWEAARKVNPTYDIINLSLDWSDITTNNFNKKLFTQMINAYIAAGGKINKSHLQAAFDGVLGNWLNWLIYNIERSCSNGKSEQKILGIEQVNQTLSTIILLNNITPSLMKAISINL